MDTMYQYNDDPTGSGNVWDLRRDEPARWHHPPALSYCHGGPTGIYGWRKRFLYILLLVLAVTALINLALTIWILRVMDFNLHGMGKLRIVEDGIKVDGNATFLQTVLANQIVSKQDRGLEIVSSNNVTVTSRSLDGNMLSKVILTEDEFIVSALRFDIKDQEGKLLLQAADDKITIGAESLEINGDKGTIFKTSVKTPIVTSDENSDLRLESPQKGLHMVATEELLLRTLIGDININSPQEIHLESSNKAVRLDAKNISLQGLPVMPLNSTAVNNHKDVYHLVYQLCVCGNNGKLFLSQPDGFCVATVQICS